MLHMQASTEVVRHLRQLWAEIDVFVQTVQRASSAAQGRPSTAVLAEVPGAVEPVPPADAPIPVAVPSGSGAGGGSTLQGCVGAGCGLLLAMSVLLLLALLANAC